MTQNLNAVTVQLLAEFPQLIPAVGELRWQEWGHEPGREQRQWWVDVTAREAGRDRLPVTWVAIDEQGDALGAVGLGEFDIEERRDRSPWVLGMIVRPDRRGLGVGARLMARLEGWAGSHGYERAWVATGGHAVDFYRKCGWQVHELIEQASGEPAVILTKPL